MQSYPWCHTLSLWSAPLKHSSGPLLIFPTAAATPHQRSRIITYIRGATCSNAADSKRHHGWTAGTSNSRLIVLALLGKRFLTTLCLVTNASVSDMISTKRYGPYCIVQEVCFPQYSTVYNSTKYPPRAVQKALRYTTHIPQGWTINRGTKIHMNNKNTAHTCFYIFHQIRPSGDRDVRKAVQQVETKVIKRGLCAQTESSSVWPSFSHIPSISVYLFWRYHTPLSQSHLFALCMSPPCPLSL